MLSKIIKQIIRTVLSVQDKIVENIKKKSCTSQENVKIRNTSNIRNPKIFAEKIKINRDSVIEGEIFTFGGIGSIEIGEYCFVGQGSRLWARKSIRIGNRVLISHNVNIHDSNSHPISSSDRHDEFRKLLGYPVASKKFLISEAIVTIEDDVWIGFNSIILKGVTIGKGAVVAAGSIVTKNVAPFTLVGGNPAKFIRSIEPEQNPGIAKNVDV